MKKFTQLLISLAIPIGVGWLSSFFTRNSTEFYDSLNLPLFAPPASVFPVVWTILYIMMGVSFYLVQTKSQSDKTEAFTLYFAQLGFNFAWSIIFFNLNLLFASFVWIIVLLFLIYKMVFAFYDHNKIAGILQVPYLFWVLFATYLNFSIIILN